MPNHHWMFDEGILTIDDDLRVVVTNAELVERDSLERLDGNPLQLPKEAPRPSRENINWRLDSTDYPDH